MGRKGYLVTSGCKHGPFIVFGAKELVRRVVHMDQMIRVGPHAPQNAKHHLDKERRFDKPLIHEPFDVVEMAQIVAFEFELRSMVVAKFFNGIADCLKRVWKDEILGHFQKRAFPVMLELGVFLQHRENAKVHRPHVQ